MHDPTKNTYRIGEDPKQGRSIVRPKDAAGSRHNLNPKTPDALRPGVTTKEDVLLTFGEPDFASEDGQRLGYAWSMVKAFWAIAGTIGGGVSGEVTRSYVVETSFDANNRVSRVRLLKEWGPGVKPNRELEDPP